MKHLMFLGTSISDIVHGFDPEFSKGKKLRGRLGVPLVHGLVAQTSQKCLGHPS